MDEEFTDAEIRTLLRKVASGRRRDEMRQRLERAGDAKDQPQDEASSESPHETPVEQPAA